MYSLLTLLIKPLHVANVGDVSYSGYCKWPSGHTLNISFGPQWILQEIKVETRKVHGDI